MKEHGAWVRLTLLQGMSILLGVFCTGYGSCIVLSIVEEAMLDIPRLMQVVEMMNAVLFAGVLVCCWWILAVFIRLLQGLKDQRAFVQQHAHRLSRLTRACFVCTSLLGVEWVTNGIVCMVRPGWMEDTFVTAGLLLLLMLSVTLMVRVLRLLMDRAIMLQNETDGIV